jgi:hypothetical protein
MALIYESEVPASYRAAFVAKVIAISARLGINPNWLMVIMHFETGGTFLPNKWNSRKTYVGLLQFGSIAAKDLGTTTTALSKMSAIQQLDYVEKYYKLWYRYLRISVPNSFVDFYLVTLFPSKVNAGHSAVIESKSIPGVAFAKANKAFTPNSQGKITIGEINRVLLTKLPSNWISSFV